MGNSSAENLPAPACVYVIGASDGPQKIGVASDVERRRYTLQIANAAALVIQATFPMSRPEAFAVEKATHAHLRNRRVHGEWFDISPDAAKEAVAAVLAKLRDDDPVKAAHRAEAAKWKQRMTLMGLSQKELAMFLGVAPNTVSHQLRGTWLHGMPKYVKTIIKMWELSDHKTRCYIRSHFEVRRRERGK